MPFADEHKELKVQRAIELIDSNSKLSMEEAYRRTRASYDRVRHRR